MGKLTALNVKHAIEPGVYVDGQGLMLVVKSKTSRSWILRFQHEGKRQDFGLGSASKVTLAEAREKLAEMAVDLPDVKQMLDFIDNSQRSLVR